MNDAHAGGATLAVIAFGQIVSKAETVKPWFQDVNLLVGIALGCLMIFYYWLKIRQLKQNKKDKDED